MYFAMVLIYLSEPAPLNPARLQRGERKRWEKTNKSYYSLKCLDVAKYELISTTDLEKK